MSAKWCKIQDLTFIFHLLKPTIEEGVVDRIAIFQQDNRQVFPTSLRNPTPSPDPPVALDNFFQRGSDDSFDPFELDVPSVRPFMGMQEVPGESHEVMIREGPERVQTSLRADRCLLPAAACLLSFCLDFVVR
jgi:hypothetical protein